MSTCTFTVRGDWRRASSADTDFEAQSITGTHAPFALPTAPAPARTPHRTTEAIDDFFGVTRPRATRESQRDSHSSLDGDIPPPPYVDANLPVYSADPNVEPFTLTMYLFKLGFLFPPAWILGAIILIFPLTAPVDFEPSKSRAERQRLVQIIRDAELKWAERCLWALLALVLAGVVVTIIAVLYS